MRSSNRVLGSGLVLLAMAVATVAALGPLIFGVLRYRISATSLNQIIGSDAAALTVVVPVTVAVAVLAIRGHPAAPVLALAPSVFVVYTYTQLIVGNEYLRLPGNVERFFPLLLAAFILAAAIAVRAWNSVPAARLPATSAGVDRTAGVLLLVIASFVVVGLHLANYLDAMRDHPVTEQYLSSPTVFWLVKFMDLGIVVPAAIAVGVGALRRRPWARKPVYALLGAYTLIGASVAGMAITMAARHDPDSSGVTVVGATVMTALLAGTTCYVYLPLFRRTGVDLGRSETTRRAPVAEAFSATPVVRQASGSEH
jgi:hypothetical protein